MYLVRPDLVRSEGICGGCYLAIGISRSFASGESATDSVWINGTHLPKRCGMIESSRRHQVDILVAW
jgi:hypothetical protein